MRVSGQEDCLFLDVYTPSLNKNKKLPVILWVTAGGWFFGRSRSYGPGNLLQEDVILVLINVRQCIFGWATTGDEAALGNWGLKDQLLAVEWVHKNIHHFGGNNKKIVIGGISSGGMAAGLMPFVNHPAREKISGIIGSTGVPFFNFALNNIGTVKNLTVMIAQQVGCPSGSSWRLMECLKRINPYDLLYAQRRANMRYSSFGYFFAPVIEANHTSAVMLELPEDQYRVGEVPSIPWIMGRGENESSYFTLGLQLASPYILPFWKQLVPRGLRGFLPHQQPAALDKREALGSIVKVCQLYFGETGWPLHAGNYYNYIRLVDDLLFGSPLWRGVKFHHKIAPTYVYTTKLNTMDDTDFGILWNSIFWPLKGLGAPHGTESVLMFNSSALVNPPREVAPGAKIAGRKFVNMLVNFAATGKPWYRTPSGELKDVWKPVTSMSDPVSLEIGLINEIKMFREPLVGSRRYKIWDEIRL